MKSMREMINLMEGVVAVPGIGANLSERANNTPLRDINDYRIRSKELQKYLMDPKTARDPALKASVMKSKNNLDQQAREMGFLDEGLKGAVVGGIAGGALTKTPMGAVRGAQVGSTIQNALTGDEEEEELTEKSTSEKQARFMAACAHGADYDSCPDDKVSKEFNKADTGTELLSKAMKESLSSYDENFISQTVKHLLPQASSMEELCTMVSSEAGYPYTPEFQALVQREANKYFGEDRPEEPEDDYTDWSMRQGEMGLEENNMKEAHVDSCRQTNPAVARKACKMEENAFDENFDTPDFPENENITLASKMYKDYLDSFVEPQEALDLVLRHFDEIGLEAEELDEIGDAIMTQYGGPSDDEPTGPDDFSMDADALASAGHGSDEDYGYYGGEDDADYMEEDLQNGYHDRHCARGDDYFPNGADSPVVRKVGPSGARHGDNPEQKKMQIEEVHKELVYGYRQFLGESFKKKINESAVVSNIEIQNESGDFESDENTISYHGVLDVSAEGVGNDGHPHEVGYSVIVSAGAEYSWETDERATGWNYKTDSETWSSEQYAAMGDVTIKNIELDPDNTYIIDNEEVSMDDFQKAVHPATLKQLLDPTAFSNLMNKTFQRHVEKLEPPTYERDYEPDDRDY